jgi:predicted cupin superfamily sugar epimerase
MILFHLPAGETSAWHRLSSDEMWLAHLGVVELELGGDGPAPEPRPPERLGPDPSDGQSPQVLVPAGVWQRTLPAESDVLVTCVVSPGFDFEDFELHSDERTEVAEG